MSKITSFVDLECWKNARKLTATVYKLEGEINKDYSFRDQIRRASISIMNNIAEGYGRFSPKEKVRFLEIAQSSANEVLSMSYLLEDLGYIDISQADFFRRLVTITQKQIWGLIKHLRVL